LTALIYRLHNLYGQTIHGFAGLTNVAVEVIGPFGDLTDNGFSTALGPPTSLNCGSAGASGYILVDGLDEVSYTRTAKESYREELQGLYVFRSGAVMIDPHGKASPEPVLGANVLRASQDVIAAAWREAVDSGGRVQLLMVLALP
jgi:hypothetical protein